MWALFWNTFESRGSIFLIGAHSILVVTTITPWLLNLKTTAQSYSQDLLQFLDSSKLEPIIKGTRLWRKNIIYKERLKYWHWHVTSTGLLVILVFVILSFNFWVKDLKLGYIQVSELASYFILNYDSGIIYFVVN